MQKLVSLAVACLFASAGSAVAQSPGWQVTGTRAAPPYRLVLPDAGKGVSYTLDCSGDVVRITETGVTELLDMSAGSNKRVADEGPDRVMPLKSAMMALYTNKDKNPDFRPGTAVANANKGWDITIEMARNDKAFRALASAQMMSLFTTGFTAAVMLGGPDRKVVANFVLNCAK
jgi:hypothetical protein